MRRGASGKQYLFLHISCLILHAAGVMRLNEAIGGWKALPNMAGRWQLHLA